MKNIDLVPVVNVGQLYFFTFSLHFLHFLQCMQPVTVLDTFNIVLNTFLTNFLIFIGYFFNLIRAVIIFTSASTLPIALTNWKPNFVNGIPSLTYDS